MNYFYDREYVRRAQAALPPLPANTPLVRFIHVTKEARRTGIRHAAAGPAGVHGDAAAGAQARRHDH
jgi:hypothetical protein